MQRTDRYGFATVALWACPLLARCLFNGAPFFD